LQLELIGLDEQNFRIWKLGVLCSRINDCMNWTRNVNGYGLGWEMLQ